jgi:hypothetical protein
VETIKTKYYGNSMENRQYAFGDIIQSKTPDDKHGNWLFQKL